jgi:hypothetical protein
MDRRPATLRVPVQVLIDSTPACVSKRYSSKAHQIHNHGMIIVYDAIGNRAMCNRSFKQPRRELEVGARNTRVWTLCIGQKQNLSDAIRFQCSVYTRQMLSVYSNGQKSVLRGRLKCISHRIVTQSFRRVSLCKRLKCCEMQTIQKLAC